MIVTYALLTTALLSLWFGGDEHAPAWRKQSWLALLAGAVVAALAAEIVRPIGLLWIAGLGISAYAFGRPQMTRESRVIAGFAIVAFSAGLMAHQLPGFNNPLVIIPTRFSPDAIPFRLHLNFDKPLIGLFILGFCHSRMERVDQWVSMLRATAPIALGLIALIVALSVASGYVRFDPKFPREAWLWMWVNLCFTCVAEEALFRGFVQARLQRSWQHHPRGPWLALGVAAVLFGIAHAAGGLAYVALATIAGLGYGYAYLRTGRIEASILTHFALNSVHFFGFTYPALARTL